MTNLRDEFARLLNGEPDAPYDIEQIVRSGRRARRRRNAALATASTVGVAGITAAVVVPVMAAGGDGASVSQLASKPDPTPTASATKGNCYLIASPPKTAKRVLDRLTQSGKVGDSPTVTRVKGAGHGNKVVLEVCTQGTTPDDLKSDDAQTDQPPAGPPYHYTEKPETIAARLGAHLQHRVSGFGLDITYTRPFSQESSKLDDGRPSYYGGNVDVHEENGYADIGVQVTHEVTEQVPFSGDCTEADGCTETTLADGSVLRTGKVKAGPGAVVLTAEVHRPDGVVVQAQESNYPFGPDAGTQPHGDQPLTLDQLIALAKDDAFTF